MKTKINSVRAFFLVASVALLGAMGNAMAADEWFELGQQTLQSTDPSVEIKIDAGRLEKDVKQVKLSAEGADVEVTNLVLHWDNRPDDTKSDVGVLKAGGESAPANAPGLKARLKSVTVQYKIQGDSPTATLKVWGYD